MVHGLHKFVVPQSCRRSMTPYRMASNLVVSLTIFKLSADHQRLLASPNDMCEAGSRSPCSRSKEFRGVHCPKSDCGVHFAKHFFAAKPSPLLGWLVLMFWSTQNVGRALLLHSGVDRRRAQICQFLDLIRC